MQYKSKVMNCLEMIDLSRSILACDNILINKHPEWSKKGWVQQRLCLDYSNPRDWAKEKLLCKNLNVKPTWLSRYKNNLSLSELINLNVDMDQVTELIDCGFCLNPTSLLGIHTLWMLPYLLGLDFLPVPVCPFCLSFCHFSLDSITD